MDHLARAASLAESDVSPMRLPPGVSQSDFDQAISQFQAAVGKDWVFTSDEDTDLYRDAYSPFYGE